MRTNIIAFVLLILAGCGGYQERAASLEEDTVLVIRGESLVGLQVSIDNGFNKIIQESDLSKYKMGVLGSANTEIEDLQSVYLKVNSGLQLVTISSNGRVVFRQEMMFSDGQTRELKIPR